MNYTKTLYLLQQIQDAFLKDESWRIPPTPQDEMRAGMSYFHETSWKEVLKFLRRDYTALKNIWINEIFLLAWVETMMVHSYFFLFLDHEKTELF